MAQWNKKQDKDKYPYSLRKMLQGKYLFFVMKEKGIEDIEELKGNTIQELIDSALLYDNSSDKGKSEVEEDKKEIGIEMESYIDGREEVLFKMLDVVLQDTKKKLRKNNKNYHFSIDNCKFFWKLLSMEEDNDHNCEDLLQENFDDLDEDFLEPFLHEGLLGLAENETTSLQIEEVNQEWNSLFNPYYKEILELQESLNMSVVYYVREIIPEDKNMDAYEKIKEILIKSEKEIVKIVEERIEPVRAVDEERAMRKLLIAPAISVLKRKKRSQSAKKGREKRKSETKDNK